MRPAVHQPAVQQARSGHPGMAMAMAPVIYQLWQHCVRFDADDPIWPHRDRFVPSCGHASMLLDLTGTRAADRLAGALR
jgi:transketolase